MRWNGDGMGMVWGWYGMVWDCIGWYWMVSDGMRRYEMVSDGVRW